MTRSRLFGPLLACTYHASGTAEPLERYYASMFADFYSETESQPSCTAVRKILTGKSIVSWKILQHYHDSDRPRSPRKLEQDLSALADCCFAEAHRRGLLRKCLEAYLESIPCADQEDLRNQISGDDLIQLWTELTWYALCGDRHG